MVRRTSWDSVYYSRCLLVCSCWLDSESSFGRAQKKDLFRRTKLELRCPSFVSWLPGGWRFQRWEMRQLPDVRRRIWLPTTLQPQKQLQSWKTCADELGQFPKRASCASFYQSHSHSFDGLDIRTRSTIGKQATQRMS